MAKKMRHTILSPCLLSIHCGEFELYPRYVVFLWFLSQAFLHSLSSNATKGSSRTITAPVPVQIMTCEGDSVKDSKLVSGVLLQAPDIPTFEHQSRTLVNHTSKVALFNISMAGDIVEWFSDNIKIETTSTGHDVSMANATLQRILKVADWLVANGVEVIACQKCMHPALKRYLKDKVCITAGST